MDCSLPGSSVHGLFQARVLEWVAISFCRGSFPPGIEPGSSRIASTRFPSEPPGKPRREEQQLKIVALLVPGGALTSKTRKLAAGQRVRMRRVGARGLRAPLGVAASVPASCRAGGLGAEERLPRNFCRPTPGASLALQVGAHGLHAVCVYARMQVYVCTRV